MDRHGGPGEGDDCRAALLPGDATKEEEQLQAGCCGSLARRVSEESRKLWEIVGPAIFTRTVTYSMTVIMQAFAGHLGDLELASASVAITVLIGFNYGLMLGLASALETLCGQAFGAKKLHMMGVYLQRSWIVLFMCAVSPVHPRFAPVSCGFSTQSTSGWFEWVGLVYVVWGGGRQAVWTGLVLQFEQFETVQ